MFTCAFSSDYRGVHDFAERLSRAVCEAGLVVILGTYWELRRMLRDEDTKYTSGQTFQDPKQPHHEASMKRTDRMLIVILLAQPVFYSQVHHKPVAICRFPFL